MKKLSFLLLMTLSLFVFSGCEDSESTSDLNYVSFENSTFSFGVEQDGSSTSSVTFYSTQTSSSARTFEISVDAASTADAASYTVPTSITIPANSNTGTFDVTISDTNISEDGETLILNFSAKSGLITGASITLNIKRVCPLNNLVLSITFDSYPDEVYWVLKDGTGAIIEESSAAGWGAYTGMTGGITKEFCLANGDYSFTIQDAYADGGGAVSLKVGDTYILDSDGAYGAGLTVNFTL
ncbi:MAG: hypothetical protein JKY44_01220 [Flavobacteriaceae bacterium]|nr:hypothetical protein [Flavobacteriaceae bacterium]